jgi:organic hydroperoxide reductase OsmC/OhrA
METVGTVTLTLEGDLRFEVDFGLAGVPGLATDATPPLGQGRGPDSERLLLAAVGNCLSASLVFSLRKFRNEAVPIRTTVEGTLARNAQGRLRVHGIAVDIRLGLPAASLRMVERAVAQYEDFCTVTESVRAAIPVTARVYDSAGVLLGGSLPSTAGQTTRE